MTTISIRPVNQSNWRDIIALKPQPCQRAFIEPNEVSLLEAAYDRSLLWQCYGLYEDDVAAGFLMFGARTLWRRDIWLDRFMLDASFQGQGNSHRFMDECIRFISRRWLVKRIKVSIVTGNDVGIRLFEHHGFVDTGRDDPEFNERVYVLTLPGR